jgi:hypothetical protein
MGDVQGIDLLDLNVYLLKRHRSLFERCRFILYLSILYHEHFIID